MSRFESAIWALRGYDSRNQYLASRGLPRQSEQRAAPLNQQLSFPLWPDGQPVWHMENLEAYLKEGFSGNSLIYSAIMFKVSAISQTRFRAFTGDPTNPEPAPDSNPTGQLLKRPNEDQSTVEYLSSIVVSLNLAGNAYVWQEREQEDNLNSPVKALWPIRSDWVFPVAKDNRINGYVYAPRKQASQAIPLVKEDVIHIKLPNPLDKFGGTGEGLSPIASMAQSADVDNQVTHFLKIFFERGTNVGAVIGFPREVNLNKRVVDKIRSRYRELFGSTENWSRDPLVLDRGATFTPISRNFEDMGFKSIDERNETRILGPFGVPPILVGSRVGLERSTYSNYEQARTAFWEDRFIYELRLIEDEHRYHLDEAGIFVAFDLGDVPALQPNVTDQIANYTNLVRHLIPPNQAMQMVGLKGELLPADIGDTSWAPLGFVPAGSGGAGGGSLQNPGNELSVVEVQPVKRQAIPAKVKPDYDIMRKQAIAAAHEDIAADWETEFEDAVGEAFEHEQDELLALLHGIEKGLRRRKATIDWLKVESTWLDYYTNSANENWREVFVPRIEGVVTDQGNAWNAQFGFDFDVQNLFALQWFDDYQINFAQDINATTEVDIRAMLQQAHLEGWPVRDMENRLGLLFTQYLDGDTSPEEWAWYEERMPRHRRSAIARTETLRASNAGSHALFGEWGVTHKQWLATGDDRTRATHLQAELDYGPDTAGIAMSETFQVGNSRLMYPLDSAGSAEETVNCRCVSLPVVEN